MLKSKAIATIFLILIILFICFTFTWRVQWWAYFDILFLFVAAFMHLMATFQPAQLKKVARKMDLCAGVSLLLGGISLIGEMIAYYA